MACATEVENSGTPTEITSKESSKMTRPMDMESTLTQMVPYMREIGSKTNRTEKARRLWRMALSTKETSRTARKKAKESSSGRTALAMKETGVRT